jgi:AcrR family transcriptional regulator
MAASAPEGPSPRQRQILAAARELLEQEGAEGMSMRRLADRLGIRAPSLYKHVPDKQALEAAIISDAFAELAARSEAAVQTAPDDRLGAIAAAYRAYAREHPHLYRLMTGGPLPRERLVPGVEERAAQPLVDALDGDADLARAAWSLAHGLTILELDGRFPPGADVDAAWVAGLGAIRAVLGGAVIRT